MVCYQERILSTELTFEALKSWREDEVHKSFYTTTFVLSVHDTAPFRQVSLYSNLPQE